MPVRSRAWRVTKHPDFDAPTAAVNDPCAQMRVIVFACFDLIRDCAKAASDVGNVFDGEFE
jgi:hypothetical protein